MANLLQLAEYMGYSARTNAKGDPFIVNPGESWINAVEYDPAHNAEQAGELLERFKFMVWFNVEWLASENDHKADAYSGKTWMEAVTNASLNMIIAHRGK